MLRNGGGGVFAVMTSQVRAGLHGLGAQLT